VSGQAIAAQVRAGLLQALGATGQVSYSSTLRKKSGASYTYSDITCVSVNKKSFDAVNMVQRTNRVLLVDPTGPVPKKGDHVGVGFASVNFEDVSQWARIGSVEEINPSGVVLLYRVKLEE
jgi:hypothetical protein